MQVNNNYQINFQGLNFHTKYNASVEKEVKGILYKKLPQEEVDSFFSILKKSPVETTLGLADSKPFDRLDAMITYKTPFAKDEDFSYIEEGRVRNLLNFKPRNFIHKVLMKVESLEETYQIGRYAQ